MKYVVAWDFSSTSTLALRATKHCFLRPDDKIIVFHCWDRFVNTVFVSKVFFLFAKIYLTIISNKHCQFSLYLSSSHPVTSEELTHTIRDLGCEGLFAFPQTILAKGANFVQLDWHRHTATKNYVFSNSRTKECNFGVCIDSRFCNFSFIYFGISTSAVEECVVEKVAPETSDTPNVPTRIMNFASSRNAGLC
jgi:hypothetical protein